MRLIPYRLPGGIYQPIPHSAALRIVKKQLQKNKNYSASDDNFLHTSGIFYEVGYQKRTPQPDLLYVYAP
jgi:hypothetical protein